jgi:hypothetical protein
VGRDTNRQRRKRRASSAQEKAAAARVAQARTDQRRRAKTILSFVVAIALVVGLVTYLGVSRNSSRNDISGNPMPISSAVLRDVTSVSPSTFEAVGAGTAQLGIERISQPSISLNGEPELLFIGGEFCPICAAERWSLTVALSRFGKFSNLEMLHSAVDDGDLATLGYHGSTYTSKYLAFVPVENLDRNRQPLETLTSAELALYKAAAGTSQLAYPFLDFGGDYMMRTEGYDGATVLGTSTQQQIAVQLDDPSSSVAKAIVGEANNLTAAICEMTEQQPSSVCSGPEITSIQSSLNA